MIASKSHAPASRGAIVTPPKSRLQICSSHQRPVVTWATVRNELKASALSSKDKTLYNHMKSRGWKQKIIQSRFDFSASQCIPVCGTTFRVMCVHHHHVLIQTKLGQSLFVEDSNHALILSTSRHSLSPDSMLLVQDVACIQRARSITSNHHAASGRCGVHHLVCPLIQLVCRPVSKWWRIEPNQQEVQLRRFYTHGSSPALYASLWRGHFTDLPGFANVQFNCNNETCMSICPSSHPVAPLEKSVSSQHTMSHRRTMSTWSFGTGQENHVVCLKSEQNLFQSASLPRTRRNRIVGADL